MSELLPMPHLSNSEYAAYQQGQESGRAFVLGQESRDAEVAELQARISRARTYAQVVVTMSGVEAVREYGAQILAFLESES